MPNRTASMLVPSLSALEAKGMIPYKERMDMLTLMEFVKTKDIPSIVRHLAQLPKKNTTRPRTVIITQGTDPTVVAVSSSDGGEPSVKQFPVHPIDKSEINDTTGAG